MFERDQSLGYLANRLARILSQRLRDRLQPMRLMPAQFTALVEISRDQGLSQKMLVERLDFEQAGIARTLRELEEGGWIERRNDETDGRMQRLFLTEMAAAQIETASEQAMTVNAEAMAPLDDDERADLLRSLTTIIAGLRPKP